LKQISGGVMRAGHRAPTRAFQPIFRRSAW